jgi:CRISPR-associated protein Cmr1
METIEATYRVTTPMFLGGADQQAELRLASFKGVLRFWWRALAWSELKGDMDRIQREESRLFGSTSNGQSLVVLKRGEHWSLTEFRSTLSHGLVYLAGMGLSKPNGTPLRAAAAPGLRFTVQALLRDDSQELLSAVVRVLKVIGLFGGLGSRSRRGFGSLTLEALVLRGQRQDLPVGAGPIANQLTELVAGRTQAEGEPHYTAFSSNSRVLLVEGRRGQSGGDLLERLGCEFLRYRSWGIQSKRGEHRNGLGERAEQQFPKDHEIMHQFLSKGKRPTDMPTRAVFGLPHNYFFGSLSGPPDLLVRAEVVPESETRRASPLFFHVHGSEGGPSLATVAFLPGQFLPSGERLRISDTSRDRQRTRERQRDALVNVTNTGLWEPVSKFLDRLRDESQNQFASVTEVAHA